MKLNDHVNSHFYLAKIAEANEDVDTAIRHWEKFVELGADSPQAASAKERIGKLIAIRDAANEGEQTAS